MVADEELMPLYDDTRRRHYAAIERRQICAGEFTLLR